MFTLCVSLACEARFGGIIMNCNFQISVVIKISGSLGVNARTKDLKSSYQIQFTEKKAYVNSVKAYLPKSKGAITSCRKNTFLAKTIDCNDVTLVSI